MFKKKIQKTDFVTVGLHWSLFIALIFSLLTGFRIAADAPDAGWTKFLSVILLQGNVIQWHSWAAIALGFIMVAYIVFLMRAHLGKRVALDAVQRKNLKSGGRKERLKAVNILIYWLAFLMLGASVVSGLILYLFPGLLPFWMATDVHRVLAWLVVGYVALHVVAQLALGGISQLLKILNPTVAYGTAAISTVAIGGAAMAGIYLVDQNMIEELSVAKTATPPKVDGKSDDKAWAMAKSVDIPTGRGVNSPDGEMVTVRMTHDGDKLYALFEWPDSTRSRKHLPLQKTKEGWKVIQNEFDIQDEDTFYEDKFGVMFASHHELAGAGTAHLGPKPIAHKPAPSGGRGLHYTTDGSIVDVWHWKSVRTGALNQIDDNYFGPPMEPNPKKKRYTGGYTQDPKTGGGYKMNWEKFSTGIITPKRLPKDPSMLDGVKNASLDSTKSDNAQFSMKMSDTIPYDKKHDTYPLGTIMPSVLIKGPHKGDRGQVWAKSEWKNGRWTLEVQRKLDTKSKYDLALNKDTPLYMWVAVFNHTQTRHSQHLHPVRVVMQ